MPGVITAYIGLGSNLGDSLLVLQKAWQALGRLPGITLGQLSEPYRTEPVGMSGGNWFINAAGSLRTTLEPEELLDDLLAVEKLFGRIRDRGGERYQNRILDLDLLLYGQLVMHGGRLVLPHPELSRRAFVLIPLCGIAADVPHPVLHRTMGQLLSSLPAAESEPMVEKISWPLPENCVQHICDRLI
jgi:2-amino-4-hydroxy-6-hydroxymethyldihydropteridine diphosphokinase